MKTLLKGKKILITGGAGSVGRALTKRILKYSPEVVRILDLSENEMFKMRSNFGDKIMRYLIGDIRDINRLKLAMEGIDIVVHLAAMKHVYACEYNPFEAIKTNIDGLQNVINVARDENVQKVIFSSTDKAANPSSVMGTTKLLGEKLISLANCIGHKKTVFASVRFGNVIGSNGSVVPLFKNQILENMPLTITDKEMTRFVITMDEAVDLICNAIMLAKGGETFVWKMRTLKVTDLSRVMINKYGKGKEIKKIIIGKREGEKLHEDIMSGDEFLRAVEFKNFYIVFPMIDYTNVVGKYKNAKKIKNPIISSDMGKHMSSKEIDQLFKNIDI